MQKICCWRSDFGNLRRQPREVTRIEAALRCVRGGGKRQRRGKPTSARGHLLTCAHTAVEKDGSVTINLAAGMGWSRRKNGGKIQRQAFYWGDARRLRGSEGVLSKAPARRSATTRQTPIAESGKVQAYINFATNSMLLPISEGSGFPGHIEEILRTNSSSYHVRGQKAHLLVCAGLPTARPLGYTDGRRKPTPTTTPAALNRRSRAEHSRKMSRRCVSSVDQGVVHLPASPAVTGSDR